MSQGSSVSRLIINSASRSASVKRRVYIWLKKIENEDKDALCRRTAAILARTLFAIFIGKGI